MDRLEPRPQDDAEFVGAAIEQRAIRRTLRGKRVFREKLRRGGAADRRRIESARFGDRTRKREARRAAFVDEVEHAASTHRRQRHYSIGEVAGKRRRSHLVDHALHAAAIADDIEDGARKVLASAAVEPGRASNRERWIGAEHGGFAGEFALAIDGERVGDRILRIWRAAIPGKDKISPDSQDIRLHALRGPGNVFAARGVHSLSSGRVALTSINVGVRRRVNHDVGPDLADRVVDRGGTRDIGDEVDPGHRPAADSDHLRPGALECGAQVSAELAAGADDQHP